MISFEDLRKETSLITKELANVETQKFHGQKEEFPHWMSKVKKSSPATTLKSTSNLRWLSRSFKVMHLNGGKSTSIREGENLEEVEE